MLNLTKDEAIEAIKSNMPTSGYYVLREALWLAIQAIEDYRGKGCWGHELDEGGWVSHTCSNCGYTKLTDIHVSLGWNFCPNCGADMRGEKNGRNCE